MYASREFQSAEYLTEYLTSDSPDDDDDADEQQKLQAGGVGMGGEAVRTGELRRAAPHRQQSSDFGFIDLHPQHPQPQQEREEEGEGTEMDMAVMGGLGLLVGEQPVISAASLNFRASTVLTEKIIVEIAASIKVFRPSRSLHQLVTDREEGRAGGDGGADSSGAISIDLVVSGGGLKGYFVCGCVSVLQRQLASHNMHIARVSGASAGAWSGFFICTGITTAMWMESYYKCYDNPHRCVCVCVCASYEGETCCLSLSRFPGVLPSSCL